MRKWIGNVLLASGVFVIAYVGFQHGYKLYLEKKILSDTIVTAEALLPPGVDANQEGVPNDMRIVIPKLSLDVPVLEGATKDNLRVAVTHLEGTGRVGIKGENSVILGHRSFVTGEFFSELDKLQKGDTFSITSSSTEFEYEVVDQKIIDPSDLSVLSTIPEESLVTLITCHPRYSSKQRLVVIAKQKG
ncbi:class D sortase [Robertmurraya korlensis]|uniref:class D sortase n=1 Tax=Robertmurraya korlensis TaxID=519977 RepID=UPI0008241FBB|nr:class D sortase [Robertmurraya korlensis]